MKRNILAATVLVLASITCASAQIRDEEKSLQGLPGIRVFISWGRTDPIAGDRLPGWKKLLQDLADAKMQEAGIPMLKTADQTEPAGDPRLVVHVRLNRPHESTTIVEFETKFWQMVQLSRDPSTKVQAVTWETFGVGAPEVDEKMLAGLLNDQLDRFIKAYRMVNPKLSASR